MTGVEHYVHAEQLLDAAKAINPAATASMSAALGAAQVHATLAVAAEQRRIADFLDPMTEGSALVWATVEGTAYAGAVRAEVRQV